MKMYMSKKSKEKQNQLDKLYKRAVMAIIDGRLLGARFTIYKNVTYNSKAATHRLHLYYIHSGQRSPTFVTIARWRSSDEMAWGAKTITADEAAEYVEANKHKLLSKDSK